MIILIGNEEDFMGCDEYFGQRGASTDSGSITMLIGLECLFGHR